MSLNKTSLIQKWRRTAPTPEMLSGKTTWLSVLPKTQTTPHVIQRRYSRSIIISKINSVRAKEKIKLYVTEHGPCQFSELGRMFTVTRECVRKIVKKDKELSALYLAYNRDKSFENYEAELKKGMEKYGTAVTFENFHASRLRSAQVRKLAYKKRNAGTKSLRCNLLWGDLAWPSHCPVLGMELDYFTYPSREENSPSFDRILPEEGYTKENTRIISWRANRIKNNGTAEEHRAIARYVDRCEAEKLACQQESVVHLQQ